MKKNIVLTAFICSSILLLASCVKTCTCENPDANKPPTEIEVNPSESCSDYSYSSANLATCS
ncbi:MAG: hypothetical protein FWC34_01445 [Bacteroidetes bacterium]|nr:hypothetical protein [Bacteroidota bacterium]MCL2303639.1 hypothetical protein [Lentimicrobiaceae bacterium]